MGIGLGGPAEPSGAFVRYIRLKESTLWAWLGAAALFGVTVGVAAGLLLN